MTDETLRKRKLGGAAIAGAVERPILYPKTLAVMISQDLYDAIGEAAEAAGESKAAVARDWLEKGMRT